jgi:hypothetical protein
VQVGQMRPRLDGSGLMPQPGTTEWCLLLVVLFEIGLLIVLRRYFGSRAHGG